MHYINELINVFIPVVDHELLHGQQSIVADKLVLVVHVIHHQLFTTQLLNHPEMEGIKRDDGENVFICTENRYFFHVLGH